MRRLVSHERLCRIQSQHGRVIDVELQPDTRVTGVEDLRSQCEIRHAVAGRINRIDHLKQRSGSHAAEGLRGQPKIFGQSVHCSGLLLRGRATGKDIDLPGAEGLRIFGREFKFSAKLRGAIRQPRGAKPARIFAHRRVDQYHCDLGCTRRVCQRSGRMLVGNLDLYRAEACCACGGESFQQRQFRKQQRDIG